jgi:hypothetical protein
MVGWPITQFHGGSIWWNKAVHLIEGGKQRERQKEAGAPIVLQGHTHSDLTYSH